MREKDVGSQVEMIKAQKAAQVGGKVKLWVTWNNKELVEVEDKLLGP